MSALPPEAVPATAGAAEAQTAEMIDHPATSTVEPTAPATAEAPPRRVKAPRKKPKKGDKQSKETSGVAESTKKSKHPEQQQRDREFAKRKAHILSHLNSNACDLSPKGSVDVKCSPIMAILNPHEDYVTTSSCSGRIALFHSVSPSDDDAPSSSAEHVKEDNEETHAADASTTVTSAGKKKWKRGAESALRWLAVKHGMLTAEQMLLVVRYLCGEPATEADRALDAAKQTEWAAHYAAHHDEGVYDGALEGALATIEDTNSLPPVPDFGTMALKMEPFVLHVDCRTMESAKLLLSAAVSDAGYRNSGVTPPGKKIMCAIRCTTGLGLEVPLVMGGVNYAAGQRAYVWALLSVANEKMYGNERKTKLLETSVAKRLTPGASP